MNFKQTARVSFVSLLDNLQKKGFKIVAKNENVLDIKSPKGIVLTASEKEAIKKYKIELICLLLQEQAYFWAKALGYKRADLESERLAATEQQKNNAAGVMRAVEQWKEKTKLLNEKQVELFEEDPF